LDEFNALIFAGKDRVQSERSPCNGGSLREVMSTYGSGWNSQEQWLKYIQRHDLEE